MSDIKQIIQPHPIECEGRRSTLPVYSVGEERAVYPPEPKAQPKASMFQRIKCLFGAHAWETDEPDGRHCSCCLRSQTMIGGVWW